MINTLQPSVFELIADEKGMLTHARSGLPVSQFEIEGKNLKGHKMLMRFAGDKPGFVGMQLTQVREPVYFARLNNGERVQLKMEKPQ